MGVAHDALGEKPDRLVEAARALVVEHHVEPDPVRLAMLEGVLEGRLEGHTAKTLPRSGDDDAAQLDGVVEAAEAREQHEADELAREADR